jgi:hypothetical protein
MQEVITSTILVRDSDLPLVERRDFFAECLRSRGRTALLLSGGGNSLYLVMQH